MSIIVNGELMRNTKYTGVKTVVKGLRAEPCFFALIDKVAEKQGITRNELIVREMFNYCEKVGKDG